MTVKASHFVFIVIEMNSVVNQVKGYKVLLTSG